MGDRLDVNTILVDIHKGRSVTLEEARRAEYYVETMDRLTRFSNPDASASGILYPEGIWSKIRKLIKEKEA